MSTQSVASYLPDSQVITLKPHFAALDDPTNLRGFQGPDQIGFIFHEWSHYLHNVSTIQGLSAFANLVHLWGVFRYTIGSDGLSAGSVVLNAGQALNLKQKVIFMNAARRPRQNQLAQNLLLQEIEFISVSERAAPCEGTPFSFNTIICQIAIARSDGRKDQQLIEIGTHEILESVAFMLEERLVHKLGSIPKLPRVDPYLLVRGVARHVAPGISDDLVVLCALASLQDSDPPNVILEIFRLIGAAIEKGDDPHQLLRNRLDDVLTENQTWAEDILQEIDSVFPNDEPMARAVKCTTRRIRQNLSCRRTTPFLEMELIEQIAANTSNLNEIIKTYGACAFVQQRPGSLDDIDRDLMYDLAHEPSPDDELSFGWRMMHAAFRFVVLHCKENEVLPTKMLQGSQTKCPFYNACSSRFRRERENDCKTQPWLAARTDINELCWYGRAVRAISPPAISADSPA